MDDLISRQAVLAILHNHLFDNANRTWTYAELKIINEEMERLPTVAIPSKVGHWKMISPAAIYECSECGQHVITQDICAYHYCHGCGAKMD